VGLETPDDAAVYRLDAERALVASLDFFTPLVDDAEDFGAIAAANALSDLYAMRAEPLFALNILAVPAHTLSDEVVAGIIRGAISVCEEAGIPVVGGHSIDDPEPKFGLVAIGLAHPDRLYLKTGALAGDAIVLGKALGTGVITTGIKQGKAAPDFVTEAVRSMRRLNRAALEVLEPFDVHAATDVTGYGLLGHLLEMCRASKVGASVRASAPLLLPGARELAAAGCVPGGTNRNRRAVEQDAEWDDKIDEVQRILLCDAQTSGGLLAAVPADQGEALATAWSEAGYAAAVVGELTKDEASPRIRIEP
jgi:selenide,water dikinase